MLSVAKVQRRNAWRYYVRGVAFGDGRRPVGQSLKGALRRPGFRPGVDGARPGRARAYRRTDGDRAADGAGLRAAPAPGRRPDRARAPGRRCRSGDGPAGHCSGPAGRRDRATQGDPLFALDFTFRAQASLIVLWALGDDHTRRVIERAHERAIDTALRWLEDEVAETRWSSGRQRAKTPGLVVAKWRHFDNRDGFPLLHDHCLVLNRAQRPDGSWYALNTVRLFQNVVAAGSLYTLAMTTEVCEELGLATVPRR
ncbi:MobF family relaxase [Streptomyces sp. M10(2022)]